MLIICILADVHFAVNGWDHRFRSGVTTYIVVELLTVVVFG